MLRGVGVIGIAESQEQRKIKEEEEKKEQEKKEQEKKEQEKKEQDCFVVFFANVRFT